MSKTYSTVDRLANKARAAGQGVGDGSVILTLIVLLSGVLSAIFFWQNAGAVFSGIWSPLALILALAVGLLFNEGAYFGWKRLRSSKRDLTTNQLWATKYGIVFAIAGSIFGTFALLTLNFSQVPAELALYRDWFAYTALVVPGMVQVSLTAYYAVNEQHVVENYETAKLAALGFDAYIRNEQARIQAIIDGMSAALDKQLEGYGQNVGADEAARLLAGGSQELLNIGRPPKIAPPGGATPPANENRVPRLDTIRQRLLDRQAAQAGEEQPANGANFTGGGSL